MAEFFIGQEFTGMYPPEAAQWCNERGVRILELKGAGGTRRFAIAAEPEPTEEETLEAAKAERAAAVAALTVTVDGMVFDGDEKAQERMARAVLMAETPDEKTEWVLHDNTVALVTADQLRRACRAAGKAQTALWTVPYTA